MQTSERSTLARIRWGGAAAVIGGLSYAAAGYLDKPGISAHTSALVSALSVAIPTLFLGGLIGLHSRLLLGAQRSFMMGAGFLLGCLGTMLGIIDALGLEPLVGLTGTGSWWWALLFTGLTLMGLGTFLREGLWSLGVLVLASSTLGWVSLLTDPAFSGVVMPVRPVHVAFAAVFCMSAIAWGGVLFLGPRLIRLQS